MESKQPSWKREAILKFVFIITCVCKNTKMNFHCLINSMKDSYYFTLQVYDFHSLSQKILLTLDEMNMNEERPDANYCKVHKYYFHWSTTNKVNMSVGEWGNKYCIVHFNFFLYTKILQTKWLWVREGGTNY